MTFDPKANYCTFAPDNMFGVSFKKACYNHDRQYRNEVTKRLTRAEADLQLKREIYTAYMQAGYSKIGFFVANLYYYMCRLAGWSIWHD